ncbi:MAG: protein phosphatase CheZ [Gammaproteobacteria bacterium]|nr:protein phosphatase CheZ [Gammaproteobacteria bacterium]
MTNDTVLGDEVLAMAKDLVAKIEAGENEEAHAVLDEMTKVRESLLYQEIGKLTRELHTSLSSFRVDTHITDLAEKDIPDARERLRYVVSMTDEAANKTLTAVEESLPLCDSLGNRVGEISESWQRLLRREMSADEFRALSKTLASYLASSTTDVNTVKSNLNEVLMAQGFQDLTGQIIHRVIDLVEDVENNLVGLIKVAGQKVDAPTYIADEKAETTPTGPPVPGVDDSGRVSGQDEVDDLLSSLGF